MKCPPKTKQAVNITKCNQHKIFRSQNIVYIIYFIVYEFATETDSLDKN